MSQNRTSNNGWRKIANKRILHEMPFGLNYTLNQQKSSNKSWKQIAKEEVSKEMDYGENYTKDQMEKKSRKQDLRWYKSLVQHWEMSDVERVAELLRHRKEYDPEVFTHQFHKVISPLLKNYDEHPNIDKICGLLSQVVEQRMCEESSRYGMWE